MRDIRTNAVKDIDTDLIDLIFEISLQLKTQKPFHVICGYRSPGTNAQLIKRNKNAAKNSYHLRGQAIDIRIPEIQTSVLRRLAAELKKGGVGY